MAPANSGFTSGVQRLFVYGTLQPAHAPAGVRQWLETLQLVGPATVAGTLFDLGSYPGLRLGDGGQVHGQVFVLPKNPQLLATVDRYEGFDPDHLESSLYLRVLCTATLENCRQIEAWTYEYNQDLTGRCVVASGRWRP
jgi:gamma-glutamylcyclotransferase (GGCT)/AIG2-like uncharacterized protein YtfP